MAALAILFYILLASGKVDSVIVNIPSITKNVGDFADFLWNASVTPIIGSQWGLLDPSGNDPPKPVLISTKIMTNASSSNDQEYKDRVYFIGDLSIGRAWFRLTGLQTNDTNQYRATIQENGKLSLPFTVSLTVVKKEPSTTSAPSTTPSTNISSSSTTTTTTTTTTNTTTTTTTTTTPTHSSTITPIPTTSEGLKEGEIAGIAIGAVIGFIILIAIIVVVVKKSKKSHQDNLPADKKKGTEMNSPPAANA